MIGFADPKLQEVLRPELDSGEKIHWAGRPDALALGLKRAGPQTLMGIPFTLFALFWTFGATGGFSMDEGFGFFGLVWGGMFIVAGLGMLLGGLYRFSTAGETIYAVTSKRVVIMKNKGQVVSYFPADLSTLTRSGNASKGNILFGQPVQVLNNRRMPWKALPDAGFTGIANPRDVERLIREKLLATR